ncbi:hypothetical protein [Corynebacterium sp. 335C]
MSTTSGDGFIASSESMFDDEFQRAQFHRSMTVGMYAAGMAAPFVAAMLVLYLPREVSLLSILALVPTYVGEIAASSWLRRSVPRPKKPSVNRTHMVVIGIGVVLWIAAFVWRASDSAADLAPTAFVALIGAAIGVALIMAIVPWLARTMHRRDSEAIDRRLDEDDRD